MHFFPDKLKAKSLRHEKKCKKKGFRHVAHHALHLLGTAGALICTLGSSIVTAMYGVGTLILVVTVAPSFGLTLPLVAIISSSTTMSARATTEYALDTMEEIMGIFHCNEGAPLFNDLHDYVIKIQKEKGEDQESQSSCSNSSIKI